MHYSRETAVTPSDITGVPNNPMFERLMAVINDESDRSTLTSLKFAYDQVYAMVIEEESWGYKSEHLRQAAQDAFSLFDQCIHAFVNKYPAAEPERSRDKIDFTPKRLGNIPIVIANSVNLGVRSLLASARYGSTGVLMQERDAHEMQQKVEDYARILRKAHPLFREFCVLTPDAEVDDYWHFIQRYEDDYAIVVDGNRDHFNRDGKFLGIVGPTEIKRAKGMGNVPIRKIYKPAADVVQGNPDMDAMAALNRMVKNGASFLPIVDNSHVVGVTSLKSAGYSLRFPPHMDIERGGLSYLVGLRHDWKQMGELHRLIEEHKVGRGFKIDRAHLDRGTDPFKFIEAVRNLIDQLDPSLELHAGNVATGMGAVRAARAGATGIWTGIGPSPVCVTRTMTGMGVPQATAVMDVRNEIDRHNYKDVLVYGDGGTMDTPGHLSKILGVGADGVAGSTGPSKTRESSQRIENFKNPDRSTHTVTVSGNASDIVQFDTEVNLTAEPQEIFRQTQGPRKEGDTNVVPVDMAFSSLREFFHYMTNGGTSGVSFAGADSIPEYHQSAEFVFQTTAGMTEGGSRINKK